jgi:hypothetical protein
MVAIKHESTAIREAEVSAVWLQLPARLLVLRSAAPFLPFPVISATLIIPQ